MAGIHCSKTFKTSKTSQRIIFKFFSTNPLPHNEYQGSNKMQAWQVHSYGKLEEVQLSTSTRVPILAKPKDILVKVAAASVNPIDVAMLGGYGSSVLNGMREAERLCQSGSPGSSLEFPLTLGRDFAGEVVECGLGVRGLYPGDQVWGVVSPHLQGSHAEFILASASTVSRRPENLSAIDASSLPYAAMTAWSALWISAGLCVWPARGRRVLVLGGSGGVGSAALQMLKAWGAQVVTTCSTDAVPLLESLGADVVVDYTKQESDRLIQEEGPYDIVLNCAGIQGTPHLDCLKEWQLARYVTISPPLLRNTDQYGLLAGGLKSALDLLAPNLQGISAKGATVRWGFFVPSKLALSHVTELARAGKLCPVIDQSFSFSELPAAYQRQMDGHLRGKVVVHIGPPAQVQA